MLFNLAIAAFCFTAAYLCHKRGDKAFAALNFAFGLFNILVMLA